MRKSTMIWASILVVLAFTSSPFPARGGAKGPKGKKMRQLDFVDIGDITSEEGHYLQGWGPIEPKKHGGFWGDIENGGMNAPGCDFEAETLPGQTRVVWAGDCDGECLFPSDALVEGEPDSPFLVGRAASLVLIPKKGAARKIHLRVLDGQAVDEKGKLLDSFQVFVRNKHDHMILVYIFDPGPPAESRLEGGFCGEKTSATEEEWRMHEIRLPINEIRPGRPIEVIIQATGSAWSGFDTWGQLAVDWVELVGPGSKKLPAPLYD